VEVTEPDPVQDREARSREVLARFAGGDAAAFDELVTLWDRPFLELAFRLLGDLHEAEDVRQNAWVQVLRHLPARRDTSAFSNWSFRIVLNLCRDRRRRRNHRSSEGGGVPFQSLVAEPPAQEAFSPVEATARRELEDRVATALRSLPTELRECLVLRHFHQLPVAEVAGVVGRPRTTVHAQLSRALATLGRVLQGFDPEGREELPVSAADRHGPDRDRFRVGTPGPRRDERPSS
jgi:RNA polymerase sigma-70 factor (ECF subfamily)